MNQNTTQDAGKHAEPDVACSAELGRGMRAYRVTMRTTTALRDSARTDAGQYIDVHNGELTVVTDDPRKIYDTLGIGAVVSVRELGPGCIAA